MFVTPWDRRKFDISIEFRRAGPTDRFVGGLVFSADLFDRETGTRDGVALVPFARRPSRRSQEYRLAEHDLVTPRRCANVS